MRIKSNSKITSPICPLRIFRNKRRELLRRISYIRRKIILATIVFTNTLRDRNLGHKVEFQSSKELQTETKIAQIQQGLVTVAPVYPTTRARYLV